MSPGDRDSGVDLAEVVANLSLATDLGLGQPMEHVLRSWAIAMCLGEYVGIACETTPRSWNLIHEACRTFSCDYERDYKKRPIDAKTRKGWEQTCWS